MEKRVSFCEGGRSRFLEIAIVNLTSQLLLDLLHMCKLKDVASLIFCLCFKLILFY